MHGMAQRRDVTLVHSSWLKDEMRKDMMMMMMMMMMMVYIHLVHVVYHISVGTGAYV